MRMRNIMYRGHVSIAGAKFETDSGCRPITGAVVIIMNAQTFSKLMCYIAQPIGFRWQEAYNKKPFKQPHFFSLLIVSHYGDTFAELNEDGLLTTIAHVIWVLTIQNLCKYI